jgi:hypothetical protein
MLMMVPPTSAPWLFINFRKRCMLREFARLPDFLIRGQSPDAASFPVYKEIRPRVKVFAAPLALRS